MNLDQDALWTNLSHELELLLAEEPARLVPLMIHLNELLNPENSAQATARTINFMCYELIARCEPYAPEERLCILNDYFFGEKGFRLLPLKGCEPSELDLLISVCVDKRAGSAHVLSALYTHFANHLDLPIYTVHVPEACLVKWAKPEGCEFIDLMRGGARLSQEEILPYLQTGTACKESDRSLEIIPGLRILRRYLKELCDFYEGKSNLHREKLVRDVWLKMEPNECHLLGRRAVLNHRLGYTADALADFKRYFSFVERSQATSEVQSAYREIESIARLMQDPHGGSLVH